MSRNDERLPLDDELEELLSHLGEPTYSEGWQQRFQSRLQDVADDETAEHGRRGATVVELRPPQNVPVKRRSFIAQVAAVVVLIAGSVAAFHLFGPTRQQSIDVAIEDGIVVSLDVRLVERTVGPNIAEWGPYPISAWTDEGAVRAELVNPDFDPSAEGPGVDRDGLLFDEDRITLRYRRRNAFAETISFQFVEFDAQDNPVGVTNFSLAIPAATFQVCAPIVATWSSSPEGLDDGEIEFRRDPASYDPSEDARESLDPELEGAFSVTRIQVRSLNAFPDPEDGVLFDQIFPHESFDQIWTIPYSVFNEEVSPGTYWMTVTVIDSCGFATIEEKPLSV